MNPDLATLLNLISTFAIVCALVFAGLQVRTANRVRGEQAAITVIQTTQNASWIEAIALIFTLPENAEAHHVHDCGKEMERALFAFNIRLETVGYMVFCRIISLQTVDDLIGGVALGYWSRAGKWMKDYREKTNNQKMGEWSEWLADRIAERREVREYGPAQLRFRDWRE